MNDLIKSEHNENIGISKEHLVQIDLHIKSISKKSIRDEIINWFQQSTLHWLFILFVMKYHINNKELSKQGLVEEINEHLVIEGKKTITTEFRYIDDAIHKGFIESKVSENDARKKIITPSPQSIISLNNWFAHFSSDFAKIKNVDKYLKTF